MRPPAPRHSSADAATTPWPRKIQTRIATNRISVTTRLAAVSTSTSTAGCGADASPCSSASEPLVIASPAPNTARPCSWCRTRCRGPRTPNVSRRLAAVLPIAVNSNASRLASWPPVTVRSSRNSTAYAAVEATPTIAKIAIWEPVRPAAADARARPSSAETAATGSRPVSRDQPSRRMPRRSSSAVRSTSTRESGSSTQSTGTSWIRIPDRSASTSSSVSKNQVSSSTSGSSACATGRRIALNPHWASLNRARSVERSSTL